MRIVVFEAYQVGIEQAGMVREISSLIPAPWRGTPWAMNWVVEHWPEITAALAGPFDRGELRPLAALRLRPPVSVPRELLAAPENYAAHIAEMAAREASARAPNAGRSPREVGVFLKAPGSIVGPSDAIELPPWPGRWFDHEGELAFVIGRQARAVDPEEALDYIFGYTCLLDITMRTTAEHREERPMRKSFATFTPVGPVLVTADEIPAPGDLGIRVWVNGEPRQNSNGRYVGGGGRAFGQGQSGAAAGPRRSVYHRQSQRRRSHRAGGCGGGGNRPHRVHEPAGAHPGRVGTAPDPPHFPSSGL